MTEDLAKFIPRTLRDPVGFSALQSVAQPYLSSSGMSIDQQMFYLNGAREYQELICDENQQIARGVRDIGWRWFADVIEDVQIVTKRLHNSNKVLGKKAKIIFESIKTGDNGKTILDDNGNPLHDSIDTGWIEYRGFNPEEVAWELALANTIVKIAQENVGRRVSIMKHVWPDPNSSKKFRQAVNMKPVYSGEAVPDEDDGMEAAEMLDYLASLGLDDALEEEAQDILKVAHSGKSISEGIANVINLKADDLKISKKAKSLLKDGDGERYAAHLFVDNV